MRELTERERYVLICRECSNRKTLKEIGKEFNLTGESIRKMEARAKRKISGGAKW